MSAQHTPEPWRTVTDDRGYMEVINTDNTIVVIPALCRADADMKRLVACVNACAGVDTETLVAMANGEMTGSELWELPKVKAERDHLAAQVAELLAALIEHQELTRPIQRTIEAIAKAGEVK